MATVTFATLAIGALSLPARGFSPPTVPFADLGKGASGAKRVREALSMYGILAVDQVPELEFAHDSAMKALHSCELEAPHVFQTSWLVDGTKRETIASETRGGVSASLEEGVKKACPKFSEASDKLRDIISVVSGAFISSVDKNFQGMTFRKRSGGEYETLQAGLANAQELDHFHVYSAPYSRSKQWSVDFHTDDGLFIALTPAQYASKSRSSGFFLQSQTGEAVEMTYPSKAFVLFMLGSGLKNWVTKPNQGLRTPVMNGVPHAVTVPLGSTRMWYGRMFLPPPDAMSSDNIIHFSAYRNVQLGRESNSTAPVGCNLGEKKDSSVSLVVSEDNTCPSGEFHCWMRCYKMDCGPQEQPICVSKKTGTTCPPNQMGCEAKCANSQASQAKSGGFCSSDFSVSMYMQGFVNPGNSDDGCVILLWPSWELNSKMKFALGCVGTVLVGIALESIITARRYLRTKMNVGKGKFVLVEGICYGMQTCLGYFLMLVAMTYSVPLFICVVLGLLIGHITFNAFSIVSEGATPCCEGTSLYADSGAAKYQDGSNIGYYTNLGDANTREMHVPVSNPSPEVGDKKGGCCS